MHYNVLTTPTFEKETKKLHKKYPEIKKELLTLIKNLEQGNLVGDTLPEFKNKIFKVRIKNTSSQKGKRGGFRLIYYLQLNKKNIYLIAIYSKTQKENINHKLLFKILKQYNLL